MLFDIYDHRNGARSVALAERLGVENLIDGIRPPEGKLSPKDVTGRIREGLTELGWSGTVTVGRGTKITITAERGDVGLAMQFGNISRIYADLLKVQTLYIEGKIASAIIIVPHNTLLQRLRHSVGLDSRCSFVRVIRELPVFAKVITLPILVYGVYSEGDVDVKQ